jgi:peptide/nickel transport system permease protein
MIAAAAPWYAVDPMYFVIPGTFLFLLVLSFTTLGDRIRALIGSSEVRA